MRFVVFISESQQTLQEEYRVRARIIRERTALRNEIRGLLSEFGLLLPVGIGTCVKSSREYCPGAVE